MFTKNEMEEDKIIMWIMKESRKEGLHGSLQVS